MNTSECQTLLFYSTQFLSAVLFWLSVMMEKETTSVFSFFLSIKVKQCVCVSGVSHVCVLMVSRDKDTGKDKTLVQQLKRQKDVWVSLAPFPTLPSNNNNFSVQTQSLASTFWMVSESFGRLWIETGEVWESDQQEDEECAECEKQHFTNHRGGNRLYLLLSV